MVKRLRWPMDAAPQGVKLITLLAKSGKTKREPADSLFVGQRSDRTAYWVTSALSAVRSGMRNTIRRRKR